MNVGGTSVTVGVMVAVYMSVGSTICVGSEYSVLELALVGSKDSGENTGIDWQAFNNNPTPAKSTKINRNFEYFLDDFI